MSTADDSRSSEDPIEYFLQDVTYHGKTDRTRSYYERVLRDFESFLEESGVESLGDADHRDCMSYVHRLRSTKSESTVATYASYLHRFYGYMNRVGTFDTDPMTLVMEEMDESVNTDPARREVSLPEMQRFVDGVTHPLEQAILVTLLKTGMRSGELCNLDLRDLHIDAPDGEGWSVRGQIQSRPRSLFVSSEPARGAVFNGEERTASNKRQRDTTIPVDDELAAVLRRWLAVRPDPRSSADPLFVSTRGKWGARITPDMVHHVVETHARDAGWYADGGGAAENVTPHYFRHFFTTHLRDRTGERGIVKYLRGDVAQDVIDTYTHEWGDRVRSEYLDNIYHALPRRRTANS